MRLTGSLSILNLRFTLFTLLVGVAIFGGLLYTKSENYGRTTKFKIGNYDDHHPIDTLIEQAGNEWARLLAKETQDVAAAATEYRSRRGRHPPPGFGDWFQFAKSRHAIVVEDFFDQIYHDLNPFWGVEARELRWQASTYKHRIVVRNHNATFVNDTRHVWIPVWHNLVQSIASHLPDVDIPVNILDESRIVVPRETLNEYMQKELVSRNLTDSNEIISEFPSLTDLGKESLGVFDPEWNNGMHERFWNLVRVGCPDNSPGRHTEAIDFSKERPKLNFSNYLQFSYEGYVQNWTASKDPCIRPELQSLHGSFIEPISVSMSRKLFPMFGGSKLPMNNEILLPPPMYWAQDELYSGGDDHGGKWDRKINKLMWRGAASGGRNKAETWTGFQRHRFVSMTNSTSVRLAETTHASPPNFVLPSYRTYRLESVRHGLLADFVGRHCDVAFVDLVCFPRQGKSLRCPYTDAYFQIKSAKPMKAQYAYKYLPDLDGNSFSGRYRGFLLSSSLPIKATIYNEWHDSRLVPWAHFVPMDSTFMDIYGIMEYFLGSGVGISHDDAARKIALDGQSWAGRVLRREDMQIYVYRLLLEYARICDDRRTFLGYVDDFKG